MSQTETQPENSTPADEERIRKIFVKDLKSGEALHTVFKAVKKERHTSRSGKPYLAVTVVDRTGEVEARVFDNVEAAEAAFAVGDYLLVKGKTGMFHGNKQVVIDRLERLDPEPIDAAEFNWVAPPTPTPSATAEKPEKAEKHRDEEPPREGHKAARQRLLRMLDDPKMVQALDTIVQYLEKSVEDRVLSRLGDKGEKKHEPREPRHKGPRVEHRPRIDDKEAHGGEHKHEPKRDSGLPEGLAFKPLTALVGEPGTGGSGN